MKITEADLQEYRNRLARARARAEKLNRPTPEERRRQQEIRRQERIATDPKYKKAQAGHLARKLIANGAIKRYPCVICGDPHTEAHHQDYDNPSYVVFLCRYHHTLAEYYKQLNNRGEVASITQNCLRKYGETYYKTHTY